MPTVSIFLSQMPLFRIPLCAYANAFDPSIMLPTLPTIDVFQFQMSTG